MSGILWNEISANSNGGTELLCRRLESGLPAELLDQVQIIPSRLYGELDPTKIRILYLHDLPHDPESQKILANKGWQQFHKLVFVSNWQMQAYINAYRIPWSHCVVIPNSIEPITRAPSELGGDWCAPGKPVRFIYHTTPHRGLELVTAVFQKLAEEYSNIHLDVYSSFKAYGWDQQDSQFAELFKLCEDHPQISYHGFRPNDEIREALSRSDVFVYPSIWPETSCLALMEAMSAGLFCVHSNLAALYETSANWTMMYQFNEDKNQHAGQLHGILKGFLDLKDLEGYRGQLANQKAYADIFYNWNFRKQQWVDLINHLMPLPREIPEEVFVYSV